jgi:class 3 adenylate cyclase
MTIPLKSRISISATIVTTFVGLVVVMLGSVLSVGYFSSLRNTLELVGELATQSSTFVTDELSENLDPVTEQANWAASLLANGRFDPDDKQDVEDLLLGALAATSQVTVLTYVAANGEILRAYRRETGESWHLDRSPPSNPEFINRMLRAGRDSEDGFWNEIFYSERSQMSYLSFASPVRSNGDFLGIVVAAVSLNKLSEIVSDISDKNRGTVFILTEQNQVIAHPNLTSEHPELSKETPTVGIERVGDLVLEEFWAAQSYPAAVAERFENLVLRQTKVGGEDYVFSHVWIEGYGKYPWIIGQHLDAKTAEARFRSLRDSLLVSLVILALAVVLSIYFGRKIASPIKAASAGTARIADLEISKVQELPRSRITELDSQAQSFNSMLGALRWFQTYVPRSLVRRLIGRGEQAISSRERELTILFTDLVGFASASETMTAQETAELLNHHFALLAKCVEREGGTIDKFIGDALMAFWGAPDRQPDHTDRAVRSVCEIARLVQEDNALRQREGLSPVRMRMGLHCGLVVVGNIGAPERMNYTVVGDNVNIAQRMEGLGKEIAPDAEIVVLASEAVVKSMKVDVKFEPAGAFNVKGRSEPIQVFRVFPIE